MTPLAWVGLAIGVIGGIILGCLTKDPRVEYLRQMEREGRPREEIVDAAFRMDC